MAENPFGRSGVGSPAGAESGTDETQPGQSGTDLHTPPRNPFTRHAQTAAGRRFATGMHQKTKKHAPPMAGYSKGFAGAASSRPM